MKRKSGRKSGAGDKIVTNENGVKQDDADTEASVSDAGEPQEKKSKKGRGRKSKQGGAPDSPSEEVSQEDTDVEASTSDAEELPEKKSKKGKGRKSKKEKDTTPVSEDETDPLAQDDEVEYEVEAVLDEKVTKGVRHYLIRWKGYTEESDTWEPEDTLECADLIKEFKKSREKKKGDTKKKNNSRPKKKETSEETWDENEDFEVDRILDVYFHKNGKKDFLVSWKGYPASQSSWEPEDNMDCKDLIASYMAKVQKARQYDEKELRVSRKPVNRLEYRMYEGAGRRMSKRYTGKQRMHYFDAE